MNILFNLIYININIYTYVCVYMCWGGELTKWEFEEYERIDVIITAWNKRFYHESHHLLREDILKTEKLSN